jgi:glycosyltransferase involved in cell wall biosynthesis
METRVDFDDIDICMIAFNEEGFVEMSLRRLEPHFERLKLLDMESTDRTVEIAKSIFGARADIVSQPRRALLESGFAAARNSIAAHASKSWVLHVDADELLAPPDRLIIDFGGGPGECARVTRRNLLGAPGDFEPATLAALATSSVEQHVRLYRRAPHMRWESFLHEELWSGAGHAHTTSGLSNLTFDHVSAFRSHAERVEKEDLYAWILLRVQERPELQKNMQRFYLDEYIPANLEQFRFRANRFSKKHGL